MDRGHRTDTTEDTSIEDGSSDDRSHFMRHDDLYDDGIVFPTMLPPPPLLQEHATTASVYDMRSPNSLTGSMQSRRYNTMGGRVPLHQHAVDNNLYASINRHRKQEVATHNAVDMLHQQDIPLPPPPPPIAPRREHDEQLTRGLSQCSIAGCRSDTGTLTSTHSRQSKNSRKMSRGRQSPQPTTYSPARGQSSRRGKHGESIELVSTNL